MKTIFNNRNWEKNNSHKLKVYWLKIQALTVLSKSHSNKVTIYFILEIINVLQIFDREIEKPAEVSEL